MNTPKISIIVPVYNVEKWLRRCLNSILAQTFTDFELLLIDDGSPDSSGKICDEYAARDSRIKVFHKENGGVSTARNLGMEEARSEWLCFIDSDDAVCTDYLQNFVQCMDICDYDMCVSSHNVFYQGKKTTTKLNDRIYNESEMAEAENNLREEGGLVFPWNKLFRKSVMDEHKIRYDERLDSYEDELFVFDYMRYARCVYVSSKVTYLHFMEARDSLSRRYVKWSQRLLTAKLMKERMYAISNSPDYEKCIEKRYVHHLLIAIIDMYGRKAFDNRAKRLRLIETVMNQARLDGCETVLIGKLRDCICVTAKNPATLDFLLNSKHLLIRTAGRLLPRIIRKLLKKMIRIFKRLILNILPPQ